MIMKTEEQTFNYIKNKKHPVLVTILNPIHVQALLRKKKIEMVDTKNTRAAGITKSYVQAVEEK